LNVTERSERTTSMGQYLQGRQTGYTSEGNSQQRDMTDEGQQADVRHCGAPYVGLEVEVEGPGSLGSYRRHEEGRREERRLEDARHGFHCCGALTEGRLQDTRYGGCSHVGMTSEDRHGPELKGFQTAERRTEKRIFHEQRCEDYEAKSAYVTAVPMHCSRSVEGMSSEIQLTRVGPSGRQQNLKALDEALRVTQGLEIWTNNTGHLRNEETRSREDMRVREVTKAD